jgi:hypothetical protein
MLSVITTQMFPKPFFNFQNVTRHGALIVNVIQSRPKNKEKTFPALIFTNFTTVEYIIVLISYFIQIVQYMCAWKLRLEIQLCARLKYKYPPTEFHETHINEQH